MRTEPRGLYKSVTRFQESLGHLKEHYLYLGMAAPYSLIAWILMMNDLSPHIHLGVRSPYPGFVAVCVFVGIFDVLIAKPAPANARLLSILDAVACAAELACAVLLSVSSLLETDWVLFSMATVVGGMAVGWQYVRWGEKLCRLPLRDAACAVCACVALSCVVKAALRMSVMLWPLFGCLVAALVCAAGYLCQRGIEGDDGRGCLPSALHGRQDVRQPPLDTGQLVRLSAALVLLCCALGFIYNLRAPFSTNAWVPILAGYLVELAASALVFWWVAGLRRGIEAHAVLAVLGVVIAVDLLMFSSLGSVPGEISFLISNVDHSLLTLFLWIALCAVAQRLACRPRCVFAVGWVTRSLPFFVSGVVAKDTGVQMSPVVCVWLMFALLVAMALALWERSSGPTSLLGGLIDRKEGDVLAEWKRSLESSGVLSAREAEIAELLCRGRSRPFIAEQLCISENTVRNHTKNIYVKLGIHDRQSLIDSVEAFGKKSCTQKR